MLRTIGGALRSPGPALLGLIASAGVLLLAIWLPNLRLIWHVVTSGSMPLQAKASFLWSSLGAIRTNFTPLSAWLTTAVAVLFGLNVAVTTRYARQQAANARAGGLGLGGVLLALAGAGCSSCGAVVLSALLGTGAAASAVARLPLGGQEFTVLSVVVLASTLAVTARKASHPAACPPGSRPKPRPAAQPPRPARPDSKRGPMTMTAAINRYRTLAAGSALALGTVALWIMLTAWSGKTYHLAPLVVAAAPGWTARAAATRLNAPLRFAVAAVGLAATGLGWAVIDALAIEPTATIVHRQPGGVAAEVAAAALLGVLLGQAAILRGLWHLAGLAAHRAFAPALRSRASREDDAQTPSTTSSGAPVPHQSGPAHWHHPQGVWPSQDGEDSRAGDPSPARFRQPSRNPAPRP